MNRVCTMKFWLFLLILREMFEHCLNILRIYEHLVINPYYFMATIKVFLDRRRTKKDGTNPLRIRITHQRKTNAAIRFEDLTCQLLVDLLIMLAILRIILLVNLATLKI